jgi:FlaA1/EpsC-like NDP-sugar epimerase
MRVIDFAKAIAKSCGQEDVEFYKIPIRNGEKLHEEMISTIEYQRVEEGSEKYLIIGYERLNESYDIAPLNSEFHLLKSEETYQFLVDRGVL